MKYDLHSIKYEIYNEIRVRHIVNSSIEEEDNENKNVESQSHIAKMETHLERLRFESLKYDMPLLQDPHFHGFNSIPRTYFIPKINMRMFDGNYPLTWIFQNEQFFELMVKQLQNRGITKYLIKWNNIPTEDLTWEDDFFTKKHM